MSILENDRLLFPACKRRHRLWGYTLVEMLVVLFIIMLLAAVALPTLKSLLISQKSSQVARSITAYLDVARSRAVSEGRYVGVRIDRVRPDSDQIEFGSSASIQFHQLIGAPAYSGEAANAFVNLVDMANGTLRLEFNANDNQLLTLYDQDNGPIKSGDLIELPGGRKFPLEFTSKNAVLVTALVDLNAPQDSIVNSPATETFPLGHVNPITGKVKYRIHRSPIVSSTKSLLLTRGVVVDLNYSGIGLTGNQFAPDVLASPDVNEPIDIMFGPDGRVEFASVDHLGNVDAPSGLIFLCLGSPDGVRDAGSLFSEEKKAVANVMNLETIWIVINPSTGRVVSSPHSSVGSSPATMAIALEQARLLATLSDTLDAQP